MICPYCGATLVDGSRFCKRCGKQVAQGPVAQRPTGAPAPAPRPAPQPQPQPQPAPPQMPAYTEPPSNQKNGVLAKVLTAVIALLSAAAVCLAVLVVVRPTSCSMLDNRNVNEILADAYEPVLDDAANVDYLQSDDANTYQLTGKYHYYLIDLQNNGVPSLIMVADCKVHSGDKDIDCTLSRVYVYDGKTKSAQPKGDTIKAGGQISIGITPDLHGIRTRRTDTKTGKTEGTTYTLVDGNSASGAQTKPEDVGKQTEQKPNLTDVQDHSLIDKLREGSWTDADCVA